MTAERADISPRIVAFITDYIDSLEQLEVLVLVMESPSKWWDPVSIGAALGIDQGAARSALERLASRNVLEIAVTGDVRYRFQPGNQELCRVVEEFAAAWRSHRLAVIQLVSRQASPGIRNFAKAFRITRDVNR